MALGRVTVQSALGEPLRVEIEVPEINAEEVASLKARVASPETFRAQGLEFSPALQNVIITLQRRPDGRYFLQVSSDKTVTDPFMDLVLEANWSSGRIVRDYTMLFDPPNLRGSQTPLAAQVTPVPRQMPAPQTSAAPTAAPPAATSAARSSAPSAAPAPRAASAPTPRAPSPSAQAAPTQRTSAAPAAAPTPSGDGKRITVKEGDTLTRIASANKPASISLDQMLIALLRMNPAAFAGNNVNRLKAGAVLEMPSAAQASEVKAEEAQQVLVAQSRDFNEFRRRLAEGLPVRDMRSGDRIVAGKVTAQVEDKRPAAAASDKLSLSKGAVQGRPGTADKIAQQRAAQDTATRVAELNRNISELNKLETTTGSPAAGSASGARAGLALPAGTPASAARPASAGAATATAHAASSAQAHASAPAMAAAPAKASSAAHPAAMAASSTAATASSAQTASSAAAVAMPASSSASAAAVAGQAPAAALPAKKPAAAPPPPPQEPTFVEQLLDNPLIPAAVVGVLAMLLGLGFYKMRQRRKTTQVDSSFLESRLQPDSFFGASGGQRIDTAEGSSAATGSSMVYSPSQLDAAGDVDPVAEADVYLAYGRDLQAEEILKEALRTNPSRVAIHAKLLEIYAKRRDAKAFELIATEAYNLTHGDGPEWEHICDLGRELDPTNPMYRPGGEPDEGAKAAAAAAAASPGSFGATTATQAISPAPQASESAAAAAAASNVDLDLDLDFSLGDDEPPAATHATADAEKTQAMQAIPVMAAPPALDLDFGAGAPAPAAAAPVAAAPVSEPVRLDAPDLTIDENALSFDLPAASPAAAAAPQAQAAPAPAPAAAAPAEKDAGMIEFDLGSLSLDLPGSKGSAEESASAPESGHSTAGLEPQDHGDPLATKLALAEEFNAIGDPDGARSLAEEVLAEASGDLKNRAQKLLAEIG